MIRYVVQCDRPGCKSIIETSIYDDLFKKMRAELWVYHTNKYHYCSKECFINKEKPASAKDVPVQPGSVELNEELGDGIS